MGKMPFFGLIGCCWLGLAVAGCETPPTKGKFAGGTTAGSTFNPSAGKPAVAVDTPAPAKPPATGLTQERGAGAPAPSSVSSLPTRNDGAGRGGRTPGEAGLLDAPPKDPRNNAMAVGKTLPVAGADDGSQVSISRAPVTPAGMSGVALPPPPAGSNAAPLEQHPMTRSTALPMVGDDFTRPSPPPVPPGTPEMPTKTTFPPNMKPAADGDGRLIHSVPTPPPPQSAAPAVPPVDTSALPTTPTPVGGPYIGAPK